MEKILTTIFWIIFVFYLLRLALRYLLPWLLARFMRKMARNMQQQAQSYEWANQKKADNDVVVDTRQADKQKIDPEIGEDVDFEDLKEP